MIRWNRDAELLRQITRILTRLDSFETTLDDLAGQVDALTERQAQLETVVRKLATVIVKGRKV